VLEALWEVKIAGGCVLPEQLPVFRAMKEDIHWS
jgi:hypothetical protein